LRKYCDGVLGRVTAYALQLVTGEVAPQLGCLAVGRILQVANWLRDEDLDRQQGSAIHMDGASEFRITMARMLICEIAALPGLLSWPPLQSSPQVRAAVIQLGLGALRSLLRSLRLPAPFWAWSGAQRFASGLSRRSRYFYQMMATLVVREGFILALWGLQGASGCPPSARSPRAAICILHRRWRIARLEEEAVARYPLPEGREILRSVTVLLHVADGLANHLPTTSDPHGGPAASGAMLLADYALLTAVQRIAVLAPGQVEAVGRWAIERSTAALRGEAEGYCVLGLLREVVAGPARAESLKAFGRPSSPARSQHVLGGRHIARTFNLRGGK